MENRCDEEDSSTLQFLGKMKERIERKHPNKTGEEITVISRGYTVDLLANHLADLDEFRVKFNSTDDLKVKEPPKYVDIQGTHPDTERRAFCFHLECAHDVYAQIKLLTLVSPASYPALSPQLAAWEPAIKEADLQRYSMDFDFGGSSTTDYGFLWKFLQEDVPRMMEELKPFAEFWRMTGQDAAGAVKEDKTKGEGGAEAAEGIQMEAEREKKD